VKLLEGGDCQIVSYINNAHPVQHKALYEVVEKVISRTLPLWEKTLSKLPNPRIDYCEVEYAEHPDPEPESLSDEEDFDEEEFWDRHQQWRETEPIILPEPGDFVIPKEAGKLNIRQHFPDTNLQVIVKLANIELTPEKPNYDGGSWHIEGQLVRITDVSVGSDLIKVLSLRFSRTNVFALLRSTTTTMKTLPRILWTFGNVR
jgi:hypothetical protein